MKKLIVKKQETELLPNQLLTMADLAGRFNVSLQWVKKHSHVLPSIRLGKRLRRYRANDVEKWLAENLINAV